MASVSEVGAAYSPVAPKSVTYAEVANLPSYVPDDATLLPRPPPVNPLLLLDHGGLLHGGLQLPAVLCLYGIQLRCVCRLQALQLPVVLAARGLCGGPRLLQLSSEA